MALQTRPEERQAEDPGTGRLETEEDSLLVAGLRRGSEAAFLTLVQRHEGAMLRIARLHVATTASAEDVVQETWVAVLKGIGGFDGRASLKTWMYRILTNRAKTMGTRERRSTADTAAVTRELDHVDPAVPADRFLDALDTAWPGHWKQPPLPWEAGHSARSSPSVTQAVLEAVASLPPAQSLVIRLRDIEHWAAAEVCNVLQLSETNQRVLLHWARSKVRLHLVRHFRDTDQDRT